MNKPSVSPVDLMDFARTVSQQLLDEETGHAQFQDLEHFPLIPGKQAIYVMDWKENKVTYQRNIEQLLGYSENDFDDSIIHTRIHPEDIAVVSRVIKGIVEHYVNTEVGLETYLTITYRLLKKNGTPVKVLRQSGAYGTFGGGSLISNWSMLTDIGFISNNNQVEWDVNAGEVDRQKFKDRVYKEFQDFYTARELLIIQGIRKGMKSVEIADSLNISKLTVDTHRKNILRKSNSSNKEQLLNFCKRNGIF
ncbi:LuxR C-terminal-related transcriptional regulator [Ulvibacterium sp.]|uniref:LuxR C-terminal-related transcriptional regulator n=1 Tax=Ulvibacterium sp. TaxID=2665914 RepID=UPI003BAA7F8C